MTISVLVVTSEWPTVGTPDAVPFLVRRIQALREAGADVDVEAFRGGGRLRNYVKAREHVRDRLNSKKYDVAHAHYGQAGVTLLPSPVPMVVTLHGSDIQGIVGERGSYTLGGYMLSRVSRVVARRADEVIVVSESLATKLPRGVRWQVVPMGVDLEVFRPGPQADARRRLGLPLDRKLILFSGRPDVPVKRFGLAQRAVSLVADGLEVELISISGQPQAAVADHMRACDALLVTSRHEGGPATVKEALACSLRVVSLDVGDVRRWIRGLDGCVLCADDDPATIASALKHALAHRGPFEGRERVLELDERRLAALEIAVYRSAIERRARPVAL